VIVLDTAIVVREVWRAPVEYCMLELEAELSKNSMILVHLTVLAVVMLPTAAASTAANAVAAAAAAAVEDQLITAAVMTVVCTS
jgi:hypothetical protein